MKKKILITSFIFVISLSAHGALVSRLEGQAYYDTVLDVTWLTDGNVAATNQFTDILGSSVSRTGLMNRATSNTWVGLMNSLNGGAGHLGINTWRLPTVSPVNGVALDTSAQLTPDGSIDVGYNISAPGSAFPGSTAHELAHLFYNTLGNIGRLDVNNVLTGCSTISVGTCFTNTGPFQFANISNSTVRAGYWQNDFDVAFDHAFNFVPFTGQQSESGLGIARAWLVTSGDVAAIPIPAAVWLFASGLVGLMSFNIKNNFS